MGCTPKRHLRTRSMLLVLATAALISAGIHSYPLLGGSYRGVEVPCGFFVKCEPHVQPHIDKINTFPFSKIGNALGMSKVTIEKGKSECGEMELNHEEKISGKVLLRRGPPYGRSDKGELLSVREMWFFGARNKCSRYSCDVRFDRKSATEGGGMTRRRVRCRVLDDPEKAMSSSPGDKAEISRLQIIVNQLRGELKAMSQANGDSVEPSDGAMAKLQKKHDVLYKFLMKNSVFRSQ